MQSLEHTRRRCSRQVVDALVAIALLALPACSPTEPTNRALVLLFNGAGTSTNDVAAIEQLLKARAIAYATVNSAQLNAMTVSQLLSYRLMIIPGGNFINMGEGLGPETLGNIRQAVRTGMNYLGICAGAFLAGDGKYNCLNLTEGARFSFYADERRGIRKTAVLIETVGSAALEHYWEDGPELSGWGEVVGKYPDGTPAIVQGECGKGFVILAGVHPEAPANWRQGMSFTTPASDSNAYAGVLIDAALNKTRLPHY
jgi:Biotin-protein ligase, N terminal